MSTCNIIALIAESDIATGPGTVRQNVSSGSVKSARAVVITSKSGYDVISHGRRVLHDRGVVLGVPKAYRHVTVAAGDTAHIHIPVVNCGHCAQGDASCAVTLSAQLIGPTLRPVEVHRQPSDGFTVRVVPPMVPGNYTLSIYARWLGAMSSNASRAFHFGSTSGVWRAAFDENLGDSHGLDDIVAQARGDNASWSKGRKWSFGRNLMERGATVYGSPVVFDVHGPEPPAAKPNAMLPRCTADELNGVGYWEKAHPDLARGCKAASGGKSASNECFVMDKVNNDMTWRGDRCRPRFFSGDDVVGELEMHNASIVIQGDSLTNVSSVFLPLISTWRFRLVVYMQSYTRG